MTANSEKMEIEIGSIANMFWYLMNYQYANFGTFITNWAFLSQICWTIGDETLGENFMSWWSMAITRVLRWSFVELLAHGGAT